MVDTTEGPSPGGRWARIATKPWIRGLALLLLVGLAYASALGNGFVSDDLSSIFQGRAIGSLRNLPQLFLHDTMWNSVGDAFARASTVDTYRPLPMATFFIDHALYAKRAAGYHLSSILLHGLNVLLVWWLGRRLGLSENAAFMAAALFAVHPGISEAVHWINGRSDPLSMLFLLAGLLLWLPWIDGAKPGLGRGLGIALLTFFATLCKETTFVLVPAFAGLALPRLRMQRRRLDWRTGFVLASPWAIGLTVGFVARTLVLNRLAAGSGSQLGYAWVRMPLIWRDGLLSLLVPSASIRASLYNHYRVFGIWRLTEAGLTVLALVSAALWAYWRRRLSLLPWFVLVLLVALAPVALLTSFEGWAGWGRYLYPIAPIFALALAELATQLLAGRRLPGWVSAVAVCIPVLLAVHTYAAGADYRSEQQYNLAQIRDDPDSAVGYLQLGSLKRFRGHPAEAIPLLQRGVSIDPKNANGWSVLAWCYLAVGALDPAYQAARTSRALDSEDKVARFVESAVLLHQARQDEAAAVLLPLLRDDPGSTGLWQETAKAIQRFGLDSAFAAAIRKAAEDDSFRSLRSKLEALLVSPPAPT